MKQTSVRSTYNIFIEEYPFHQKLKEELVPLLEKYPDKQERKTNVKATMTEWKWNSDNDRVKRLKSCITEQVSSYFKYNPVDNNIPMSLECFSFWSNIYHKGDYTITHKHGPRSIFSFVYFLKTKWYHPPFVFTDSGKRIPPKEGTYVLFPSHLMHHVPVNRFKETRITLSGNLKLKGL